MSPVESVEAARAVGLRYVSDDRPGYGRRRSGTGFAYVDQDGRPIRNARIRSRIRALVIPPAWKQVWICPDADGHIQATGRDARGRKQYRYHPEWRALRDATKYERLAAFGDALPAIRRRIDEDLALRGLPHARVLAAVLALIDRTLIRIGNDEYARTNASYGATTMLNEHAEVDRARVMLEFRGKSGKEHATGFTDPRIARVIQRCQELPGEELFAYIDEQGTPRDVGSADVNDYLREVAGGEFSVKDFRTWGGSVLALSVLADLGPPSSRTDCKRCIVQTVKLVAAQLQNTPAVCRASYIHPVILERYEAGELPSHDDVADSSDDGLHAAERLLLDLLAQSGAPAVAA